MTSSHALVCHGRMCASRGGALVLQEMQASGVDADVGGCFGLCAWGVNVVVRHHSNHVLQILADDDVYCGVTVADAQHMSSAGDVAAQLAHRRYNRATSPQTSSIADRIAHLRMRKRS
jgi:hypothetical protein